MLGGLFFGHPEVGVFAERDEWLVAGIAARSRRRFCSGLCHDRCPGDRRPGQSAAGAASAPPPRALDILVVDDHEDTARAMARILNRLGHRVATAGTVAAAVEAFGSGPCDLVISDIGLLDGSGLDLMRRLRQNRPVVGIALSGFGTDEDVRKSKEAGFFEHLTKPVNFQKLQSVIREATEAQAATRR